VDTEEEAVKLIEECCEPVFITSKQRFGFVAPELENEQTIENLYAFGRRLETAYKAMKGEK
jgi:hypothetical protein